MAYEDDKKTTFPTRFGTPTGNANERTMLDELSGVDGIRHRARLGPDGVLTHVKTRGGHPHFWNEPVKEDSSEVFSLYLDSGAIDLLSVSPFDPRSGESSPVYYSTYQQQYYANNRLLGKIAPPDTAIRQAPANGTPGDSFKAKEGADLFGKKDCAAKCPPSMFTGKARLYAQSQLGAPVGLWKWSLEQPEYMPPQWLHDNGYTLDMHTGIYTDANNGHWLLTISGSGVLVVKLIPSRAAKELVPLLSSTGHSGDRMQIEAYILGHSRPDPSSAVFVPVSGLPPPYMLGYSWKFNWGGDKADIIEHQEGSPYHTSTHYRLTIARDMSTVVASEADRWSFVVSIVEGPVQWHAPKYSQVIASPAWFSNGLSVFGTLYGGNTGSAPVYCFYKDNDALEIVRYTGSGGESKVMYSREANPAYYGPICDWTVNLLPIGMNATPWDTFNIVEERGGSVERRQRIYNPTTLGFYANTVSGVATANSYTYYTAGMASMAYNDNWYGFQNDLNPPGYMKYSYTYDSGGPWNSVFTTEDGVTVYKSSVGSIVEEVEDMQVSQTGDYFDRHTFRDCQRVGLRYADGSHTENTYGLTVIPFLDSECAYIYTSKRTYRTETGQTGDSAWTSINNYTKFRRFTSYDGGYTFVQTAEWISCITSLPAALVAIPSPTYFTNEVVLDTTDTIASSVITRSGEYEFTSPTSLGVFFSGVDFVEQTFYTHSSVNGLLYGHGVQSLNGISSNTFTGNRPTFVGWA